MSAPVDNVDVEARLKAARVIHEKFKKVLDDILAGKPPKLVIPKRTLSNTVFDPERGILVLGEDYLERNFLDMGEARKFMQTLLMASIIYQALVENEYPTIRDLYYRGKHTIVYRDLKGRRREENTWDEQAESDAAIRDVEVYTGMLREEMLILSKEKGKVVGSMRIRSGGDIIDLSRLGHGAYAIESTPDLIEFIDVDAEFVLVVEKDAVFQQLHRIGFWKKYKSLLVTGAGQPDRATRRFVRRLHEELKLPVYILTDSIPGDEVVIIRDRATGTVHIGPIEDLIGELFTPDLEKERIEPPIDVPSWNTYTGKIEWTPVGYAYRHHIDEDLLVIETSTRGTVRVTSGHSLFVYRHGRVAVIPAARIKPGDYILAASRLPPQGPTATIPPLDVGNTHGGAIYTLIRAIEDHSKINIYTGAEGEAASKSVALALLMHGLNIAATPRGGLRIDVEPGMRVGSYVTLTRVESVSRTSYRGYVYDFAVPGTNSFTGSYGIIYHNSDPYGWYIYSVFKVGSIQLSYESERLATPKARFLGVSMTDIFGWRNKKPYLSERERRNFIIKAKDVDIRRAKELMKYSWFSNPKWRRELRIFLEKKSKLEIEALASKGLKFLAFNYIPEKIETGDWID